MSGGNKEESANVPNMVLRSKWCRGTVCGFGPFIPDSEFAGDDCQITCDIKGKPK